MELLDQLQAEGLLELASSLPALMLNGSCAPPGARDAAPAGGPASHTAPRSSSITANADAAAESAARLMHSSKKQLQHIVSGYALRTNMPGSSNVSASDGPSASKRKVARTTVDQSAGRAERGSGKGLRHFSSLVCEKVKAQGRTSYNQVADALLQELSKVAGESGEKCDEKNIRRRVYDALNVLMAMDVIQKGDKKEIIWTGPPDSSAADGLMSERLRHISEVERKQQYLQELIQQHAAIKQLMQRDPERRQQCGTELQLPFILIQAKPDATVEVKISDDMQDVQFDFYNSPFQIHDDSYVLKHMAMHERTTAAQVAAPLHRPSSVNGTERAASIQRRPSPAPTTHAPCTSSSMQQEGSTGVEAGLRVGMASMAAVASLPILPPLSSTIQQQQQMQQHFPMHFMQPPMPLAFAM